MIQRILEAVTGVLAAVSGLWLLFSIASAFFPATPVQGYGVFGQPALPLAWITALRAFTIALVGIACALALIPASTPVSSTARSVLSRG